MTQLRIKLPQKMAANFAKPARYRVFRGGRGSAKTRGAALMASVYVMRLAMAGKKGVWLCAREHLNSLEESSLEEIKGAIRSDPILEEFFEIGEKYVRTKCRNISFVFAGLRHNLDSIKSKARILGAWIEEAENVSEMAWQKLLPTVRDDVAEIWLTYNPESPDSATHRRFVENPPDGCTVTDINWRDNPWFPDILNEQRLHDKRIRPDVYDHIWEGAFLTMTDAQVFAGKIEVREFEPQTGWDGPYFGGDFGFSQDPVAAVEVWINKDEVLIRREAFKVGLELDDTATFVLGKIPRFATKASRWDNSRPESISHLKRHGLPLAMSVDKWKGSVEDGIGYLRSFRRIVIHPDCPNMQREGRLYSYKVDRLSGDVITDIVDAHNHGWDAVRYALGPMIKQRPKHGQNHAGATVGMW